ncbi:MAG: hypothetical protein AB8G11_00760 [Saprospiraceae bacterium]
MKFIISILLISSLSFLSETQSTYKTNDGKPGCKCKSSYCSCKISCSKNSNPSCASGLTCNCSCNGSANVTLPEVTQEEEEEPTNNYMSMPTANDVQNENSIATEAYFNNLNTEIGTTISGYFQTLRDAIANKDLEVYKKNAPLLENAFKNLTESEQNAYITWAVTNLTPINN